jgi:hypothetical protein
VPKAGGVFQPDIGKWLADFSTRLADPGIRSFALWFRWRFGNGETAKLGQLQSSVGLEGADEGPSGRKPASMAIVKTSTSSWLASASAV